MEDVYTLTQDNGACNGGTKRTVTIKKTELPKELRRYFRWRKDVTYDRLVQEGSYDYDRFIKYLSEKGYSA